MIIKRWFCNGFDAYFTVEAAMVLPFALSIMLFIIYTMFFQYNRCLLDQDMGVLALRGAVMQIDDKETLTGEIKEQANQIDDRKYIMWECGEINLKLKGSQICIERKGQLKYPFSSLEIGGYKLWKTGTKYENDRICPASFMRTWRKLTGRK